MVVVEMETLPEKYWVGQKVRSGFCTIVQKPERTFWPTQYLGGKA